MPTVTNGRVLYVSHPTGFYEPGVHTKYVEEQIDTDTIPLNGGVLVKTLAISSDPYMRHRMRDPSIPLFAPPVVIGQPLDNFGVGVVVRSEDASFVPGEYVIGYINFENYYVFPGPPEQQHMFKHLLKLEKHKDISPSVYVGTLGMPGKTAYSGWNCFAKEKAKTSKTVFISGAAGPVGTFVVEIAKLTNPNLKVIAVAGSAEKVAILKSIGADVAFNYKEKDVAKVLAEHGPIDIYWDNVSGPTLDAALQNMAPFGLIVACGAISGLSSKEDGVVKHFEKIFERSLTVRGFTYGGGEPAAQLATFDKEVVPLVVAGKITSREHRFVGLKKAEEALLAVHNGKNVGKSVIIAAEN